VNRLVTNMYKVYLVGYILFHYSGVHSNNLLQKSDRMCCFRRHPFVFIKLQDNTIVSGFSQTQQYVILSSRQSNILLCLTETRNNNGVFRICCVSTQMLFACALHCVYVCVCQM